ncbi:MAG: PAS domain-containing protein, partial [Alphaproteobacteria bacterium]
MGQSSATGTHPEGPDAGRISSGKDSAGRVESELSRFPGAALLAGPGGVVLDTNPAGEPLAALLDTQAGEALRQAIVSALQGRPGQINPLVLTPNAGSGVPGLAFDVAILPWGDGAAVLVLARDITLERSLRAALIESRQRYKDLVEAVSDFSWETDAHGCFTFVSSGGALGYGAAELIGALAEDLDDTGMQGGESPFTTRTPVQEIEIWVKGREGESTCLLATALPLFDANGEWRGARGLCRNITAERRHEARLAVDRNRERLLAYILGILRDEMDPARVLSAACGAVVPALPATGAAIYRRDRGGDIVCAAQSGDLPGDEQMQVLIRRQLDGDSEVELEAAGGMLFGCATNFEETWNGVLCLWRDGTSEPWSREDRVLLTEIAGQIGLT